MVVVVIVVCVVGLVVCCLVWCGFVVCLVGLDCVGRCLVCVFG